MAIPPFMKSFPKEIWMYNFKYKRWFFFKSLKNVVGHHHHAQMDRMDVHFQDGSILSIPQWSKCYLKLGSDFFIFQKKELEKQTGQQIHTQIGN
jgi:hypothetical protein